MSGAPGELEGFRCVSPVAVLRLAVGGVVRGIAVRSLSCPAGRLSSITRLRAPVEWLAKCRFR